MDITKSCGSPAGGKAFRTPSSLNDKPRKFTLSGESVWLGRFRICFIIQPCSKSLHCLKRYLPLYMNLASRAGLVQLQDKIVVRCAHTIYPYSLGAGSS